MRPPLNSLHGLGRRLGCVGRQCTPSLGKPCRCHQLGEQHWCHAKSTLLWLYPPAKNLGNRSTFTKVVQSSVNHCQSFATLYPFALLIPSNSSVHQTQIKAKRLVLSCKFLRSPGKQTTSTCFCFAWLGSVHLGWCTPTWSWMPPARPPRPMRPEPGLGELGKDPEARGLRHPPN